MIEKELQRKALNLKPIDRIRLIEVILDSLDKVDTDIEKNWVAESESRYSAYKKGNIKAIDFEKIKKKYLK